MKEEQLIGTLEEVVQAPRLMDRGIKELGRFSRNAPSFVPERRRFLRYAAVLAGLAVSGKMITGCAARTDFAGKTYGGWEVYLLNEDLIRGPSLLIHSQTGLPSDFEHHKGRGSWGSVDYDVPIGTLIVPTADAYGKILVSHSGNIALNLVHSLEYRSSYSHLSDYARVTNEMTDFDRLDQETMNKIFQDKPKLNKLMIVALSGNTGRGPGISGYQPPHLDFSIRRKVGRNQPSGVDPFKLGIDQKKPAGGADEFGLTYGGRPVYWDGKTEIDSTRGQKLLQESLDTLASRLKESELDKATVQETLKRQNNQIDLRDYLGMRVLQKKPSAPDGKPRYEFMPGSLMYALMLEFYNRSERHDFVAMLPFIFPPLKPVYQKANPNVQF